MREMLNCPNCGATIEGCKCNYCGTQFYDLADIDASHPGYLRIKLYDGSIYIVKAHLTNICLTHSFPDIASFPTLDMTFICAELLKEV